MNIKTKAPIKKILVVVLIVIVGLAAFFFYQGRDRDIPEAAKETSQRKVESFAPTSPVSVAPGVHPPKADQAPAAKDVCTENREKLQLLFAYLDRRDYMASRRPQEGSLAYVKGLLTRLLETPPSVELETDSLLKVLQNKAHFYRVLGKKDTLLLRDILRKEGDITESSFAILYQVMALQERCKADDLLLHVPIQKVYPYAVFFLNTLGGSSYLMRRDSRVRMLTRYYCILILDEANRRSLNNLGLNILPPLDILMRDLESAANLTRKGEYLETLKRIKAGY